jgi:chromosome segregation ATPase
MSTPVTRGELREELERFRQDFKQELRQEFRQEFATKADLEAWGGALLARIIDEMRLLEQRLMEDLARHTRANHEAMQTQLAAIDEKYADLPGRVNRIEATVFAPDRR